MAALIEALTILGKYQHGNKWPTHCEHDVLYIMYVEKDAPTPEERARLDELGFGWSDEVECWSSYRFGSA